ncbi:unnamed protein product [Gulo gulo]|uniref:Uncharacterized protein n=1 Tax=Gulo gulo TaxID=48420 RepID=A0A9X9LRX7_GULGU|nr:unnamed protein product [Gulo gulo]
MIFLTLPGRSRLQFSLEDGCCWPLTRFSSYLGPWPPKGCVPEGAVAQCQGCRQLQPCLSLWACWFSPSAWPPHSPRKLAEPPLCTMVGSASWAGAM